MMRIINGSNEKIVGINIVMAQTFFTRLKGLMFHKSLKAGEGLLLRPCNMIHTFGMRFPLDVVFLSEEYEVLEIIENIKPNKMAPMIKEAVITLELPVGTVKNASIHKGDQLVLL